MVELQRWDSQTVATPRSLWTWSSVFPARYWGELTGSSSVSLRVRADGPVTVRGLTTSGELRAFSQAEPVDREIQLDELEWAWCEADGESAIREVVWSAGADVELPGVVAVIPTFRREKDATNQAATFLSSELIRRVVVIDQGGTLRDHDEFIRLRGVEPERLTLVEQGNLGGSGGYARGMLESLSDPGCAVLLSDDDASLPEEALRRMLVAQALASQQGSRLIMATPMFSAEQPDRLISAAEHVDFGSFQWGAADGLRVPISVDTAPQRLFDALMLREAPNYAGWWGALLPPGTVEELGLPAPYFLKWDDAEYGLRASRRGYEVMALPGTGVWHPTWGAHKTLNTWVAMLLHRNRLATAAAYDAGRGVVWDSLLHQVKHALSLQYDVAELWAAGIRQFLAGPEWLGADIAEARSKAQAAVDALPEQAVSGSVPRNRQRFGAARGVLRSIIGVVRRSSSAELSCEATEFTWRDGLGMDRVVLTDENENVVSELRADPQRVRTILSTAIRQHTTLAWRWRRLGPGYRDALAQTTTLDYWTDVLGIRR